MHKTFIPVMYAFWNFQLHMKICIECGQGSNNVLEFKNHSMCFFKKTFLPDFYTLQVLSKDFKYTCEFNETKSAC